ncbi:hypothetical protein M3Y97_00828900 [Aphelenchoides bicaudatus]|nr:hypothetical protein M3Y97_00828900 [Aphelenchoides bicaudatus]
MAAINRNIMALTLPLHLFDTVYKCCGAFSEASSSSAASNRLAEHLMANVSILDAIRLRRVSRAFRAAGNKRLMAYKQIEVKVYKNLKQMYSHRCEKDNFERLPNTEIILMELSNDCLGIAVDTNMNSNDIQQLIRLLSNFKDYVETLLMDSPIIDLLVSQINKQQVIMLLQALRIGRKTSCANYANDIKTIATNSTIPTAYGPFFKNPQTLGHQLHVQTARTPESSLDICCRRC